MAIRQTRRGFVAAMSATGALRLFRSIGISPLVEILFAAIADMSVVPGKSAHDSEELVIAALLAHAPPLPAGGSAWIWKYLKGADNEYLFDIEYDSANAATF